MQVIQILLDHGADATTQDVNRRTSLHGASIVEVVRLLAHVVDVTAKDVHEQTPLHDVECGSWEAPSRSQRRRDNPGRTHADPAA